jgi:hypothetical protein
MLFALEISMKPTYLEKLQQPDDLEDEQQDTSGDNKELDCTKVMLKCIGEMLFIGLFAGLLIQFTVGLLYQSHYGKLRSLLVEFALGFAFD